MCEGLRSSLKLHTHSPIRVSSSLSVVFAFTKSCLVSYQAIYYFVSLSCVAIGNAVVNFL